MDANSYEQDGPVFSKSDLEMLCVNWAIYVSYA